MVNENFCSNKDIGAIFGPLFGTEMASIVCGEIIWFRAVLVIFFQTVFCEFLLFKLSLSFKNYQ